MTELMVDYRTVNVPRRHDDRHEVLAVSKQTSIPVLVDGATVLCDDDDIVPYLESKFAPLTA